MFNVHFVKLYFMIEMNNFPYYETLIELYESV